MTKTKSSFSKRLTLIMLSLVLLLLFAHAIAGKGGYFELRRMRDQKDDLTRKIECLKTDNKKIMEEIKSLKTDPKTIEKIAREELGLVRPGEIKITPNKSNSDPPSNSPSPQQLP